MLQQIVERFGLGGVRGVDRVGVDGHTSLPDLERALILEAYEASGQNLSRAARSLGANQFTASRQEDAVVAATPGRGYAVAWSSRRQRGGRSWCAPDAVKPRLAGLRPGPAAGSDG